jgi:hypothetical protein
MIYSLLLLTTFAASAPALAEGRVELLDGARNIDDIPLQYEIDEAARAAEQWADDQALLDRYHRHAALALVGTILTTRDAPGAEEGAQIVTLQVHERIRGRAALITEFQVDAPSADPDQASPTLISGYDVLVFIDQSGFLMDGRALYALEGGWAWRNRRASSFLKPRMDRDWTTEMDPQRHYVALSMAEVRDRFDRRR